KRAAVPPLAAAPPFPPAAVSSPAVEKRVVRVRWGRTLFLGAALAGVDAYWMTYMEVVWNQGYASLLSLYFNVVFTLAATLAINARVRRWRPRLALTQPEL